MQIEVLGDRYQLQDPIGRGGMATIYRAQDLRMDRTVAVKVLREVCDTLSTRGESGVSLAAPQYCAGLRLRADRWQLLYRHGVGRGHRPAPLSAFA